jgi:magnesium chelatase family protein
MLIYSIKYILALKERNNMLSKIKTGTITGFDADEVIVETDLQSGALPLFTLVGLADQTVKESKERIRSAIGNTGMRFPMKRITVNLAPADTKKVGTHFDLPIAMGILFAMLETDAPKDAAFFGELSLDGDVVANDNILALVIGLKQKGIKKFFIPARSLVQARIISGVEFYPASSLMEVYDHFAGGQKIEPVLGDLGNLLERGLYDEEDYDFADVLGQEEAKRAIEVAVAGRHNIAMIGSPGTGKSMLAKRVPHIMPPLTYDEMLECTKLYSIAGELSKVGNIIAVRPFRNPHHSSSAVALLGGGTRALPGEISLAHNGVLFLDELPEFSRFTLDNLREPLETGEISLSRANAKNRYPASFILVCAMNPCPCGYYGHPKRQCICSDNSREKYMAKISGPLLDRIDIKLTVASVDYKKLRAKSHGQGGVNLACKSSDDMRSSVNRALARQRERYDGLSFAHNSKLPDRLIKKYCAIDSETEELLELAYEKFSFSARGLNKILKVARTIADIGEEEGIKKEHVMEAINYRV